MPLANASTAFRPCKAPKSLAEAGTILITPDTLKNNSARLNVGSFALRKKCRLTDVTKQYVSALEFRCGN